MIRPATSFDISRALAIYHSARQFMRRSGHQFPFSVKFSRFPFPVTEKICKISIKRLDKR
jgi:hypothetical protein